MDCPLHIFADKLQRVSAKSLNTSEKNQCNKNTKYSSRETTNQEYRSNNHKTTFFNYQENIK